MQESKDPTSQPPKITAREIALPKGGGAIRGIGDSFQANLCSGAGTYSITLPTTPARGFDPQLALSYSSGAGNGPFGLGWSLALSKISISTSRGIPKYNDNDLYLLDGEELVKKSSTATVPNPRNQQQGSINYLITTYITRLESSYDEIELWKDDANGTSFWKVLSIANVTTFYGSDNSSRIADADDPTRVFEWLIDNTADAKGNKIIYSYIPENTQNIPATPSELNRTKTANRYIQNVNYGNYIDENKQEQFAFEIAFRYGEDNSVNPPLAWACRPDPFSTYSGGFEIRTYRLCEKVQMIHHFTKELGAPCIVKETSFTYEDVQQHTSVQFLGMSVLSTVTVTGYRTGTDGTIEEKNIPPLAFGYSSFQPPQRPDFKPILMNGKDIPGYLNPTQFLPVDLNGEGLPGFLYSTNRASFYLQPLGNGNYSSPIANTTFPIHKNITGGEAILTDIDGNSELELLVNSPTATPGFYERNNDNEWDQFTAFQNYPNNFSNPAMESVDLSLNGKTDLLLADTTRIQVYTSEGKQGYGAIETLPNEVDFPLIKRNYAQELVGFADMFGDGLSHRVKITNGSVECWPCLGYGRYGKKVTFDNPPVFDQNFDTSRLFFTDVDGSGTSDIAYVYPDRVELFMNQSGNSFSDAITVYLPEPFTSIDKISFIDLLGNGTACVVFTKIATSPKHYYYSFIGELDLDNGAKKSSMKPYLLSSINNNMGTVSQINYCSSTKFLLEDKLAGKPWITKLRFPVQVVEEVIIYDYISKARFVSNYKYHNGYYDTVERQFRGFGMVESWDSETYENFEESFNHSDFPATNLNKELFVPPVHTKTWYVNGSWTNEYEELLASYKTDYFSLDKNAYDFPASVFSDDIYNNSPETLREAYVALAGKKIRSEVYSDDGTSASINPYTVEEMNYGVTLIQSASGSNFAVFRVDDRETITYYYERNPDDPRIEQNFVLGTDPLNGMPTLSCSVSLARRNQPDPAPYPEQIIIKGTLSTSSYFNTADGSSWRLRGITYDEQGFELLGINPNGSPYFSFQDISDQANAALQNVLAYLSPASGEMEVRQLTRTRSYFWNADQSDVLPLGELSPLALLHHVSLAEFTHENITSMFGQRLTDTAIQQLGGYIYDKQSAYWENQGMIQYYFNSPGTFYLPNKTQSSSPYVLTESSVVYDDYYFSPITTTSYISSGITNVMQAFIDYQTMSPYQLIDVNDNVSQVLFDALGKVIVTSLFGTQTNVPVGGMRLLPYNGQPAEYIPRTATADKKPIDFNDVLANSDYYLQGASTYFYYDLNVFNTSYLNGSPQPNNFIILSRENYYHMPDGSVSPFLCQTGINYNDGFGRSIEQKLKTEPQTAGQECWLVSGRTVYNNKGKICEAYLPYFSDTPLYEFQDSITVPDLPPPSVTHYDPLLRVIRVDTPKGFFSMTTFTPWEQHYSDENDTIKDSVYYNEFIAGYPTDPTQQQQDEMDALQKAVHFYKTPDTSIFDNMGFVIRDIKLQEDLSQLITYYQVDILGRSLVEIDPRLYDSNSTKGTSYYNFKYTYGMADDQPIVTDSVDSGIQRHLSNIFNNLVWSLSPRDYCQVIYYDWLQRKTQLLVLKIPGTDAINSFDDFNLVEEFTYGENAPPDASAGMNLRGQIYQVNDLSGTVINNAYDILGRLLSCSRQIAKEYKTAVNWRQPVVLESDIYITQYNCNALGQRLTETTPDKSLVTNTYNVEGLLSSVTLNTNGGSPQTIIRNISYNANRLRTQVTSGNGVVTSYSYETSTLRLIKIFSQRPGLSPGTIVQDINYTYDPAGNITRVRDNAIATVFNNNQQVDPVLDYTYNAIYQLCQATGRQHPGSALIHLKTTVLTEVSSKVSSANYR